MNSNICISTNAKEMKFVRYSTNYKFFMTVLDKTIYQFHWHMFLLKHLNYSTFGKRNNRTDALGLWLFEDNQHFSFIKWKNNIDSSS